MKLRHVVVTNMYFPVAEFPTETYFLTLMGALGKRGRLFRGGRTRKTRHSGHKSWKSESWMTLLNMLGSARGIPQRHPVAIPTKIFSKAVGSHNRKCIGRSCFPECCDGQLIMTFYSAPFRTYWKMSHCGQELAYGARTMLPRLALASPLEQFCVTSIRKDGQVEVDQLYDPQDHLT